MNKGTIKTFTLFCPKKNMYIVFICSIYLGIDIDKKFRFCAQTNYAPEMTYIFYQNSKKKVCYFVRMIFIYPFSKKKKSCNLFLRLKVRSIYATTRLGVGLDR